MSKSNVVTIDPAQEAEQERASEAWPYTRFMPPMVPALLNRYAAAKSDIRYYLNGVCIELDGRYMNAIATDGHRITVVRFFCSAPAHAGEIDGGKAPSLAELVESWPDPMNVEPEGLERIVLPGDAIRKRWSSGGGAAAKLPAAFELAEVAGKPGAVLDHVELQGVGGRFPDWRRVTFPALDECPHEWLAAKIAEAEADNNGETPEILTLEAGKLKALAPAFASRTSIGMNAKYVQDAMATHIALQGAVNTAPNYRGVRMDIMDNRSVLGFTSNGEGVLNSDDVGNKQEFVFQAITKIMPMRL